MHGCQSPCYHTPPQKEICQASDGGAAAYKSPAGHRKGQPVAAQSMHGSLFFFFLFEELPERTTSIHLLEKAGDVVFAAGRPGEGVGVGCYVGGHQLGRLVAFGTTGIPNPVVVHPKTERHKIKSLK